MLVLPLTSHPQTLHREWHGSTLRLQPELPQGHGWCVAVVGGSGDICTPDLLLPSLAFQPPFPFTGTFAVPCKEAKI